MRILQKVPITVVWRILLFAGICWGLADETVAQVPQKSRTFVLTPQQNVIDLDLFTFASSIKVTHADTLITPDFYTFHDGNGTLEFHWPRFWSSLPVELSVSWQYYPVSLARNYSLNEPFELEQINSVSQDTLRFTAIRRTTREDILSESNLTSSGSITRGVIVGSNRDLGLESGLRFDLQGYITDDVYITASLSDQNTLIQPDGTTQNLREFDQVYIRLTAPKATLQLGDVDVRLQNSSIARLNRRLQGAEGSYHYQDDGSVRAAAAVIRGTYHVMEFTGRDGVQGPYRLTGENNEAFIIVVAGTENVYLDGRLLVRGEDNDYTIDYSIGELSFTNRRLMRNSHRIRVEYQYLSNSYNRTLIATESDYANVAGRRIQIGASFIREADNIATDDAFGLSEQDLDILRNAGSDRSLMRADGADSVGYRSDSPYILYARVDTLYQGQAYSIYRNLPGNPQGFYRVQFTRVGPGEGAYTRSGRSVNGILYEWVGPGNGEYEPFRQLDAPQSRQILAIRSRANIAENLHIGGEWAISTLDLNRYASNMSSITDQASNSEIGLANSDVWIGKLDLVFRHEYKGREFEYFDRVRDVEFNRRWDIRQETTSAENRFDLSGRLLFSDASFVEYQGQFLDRERQNGLRHDINAQSLEEGLPFFQSRAGFLRSENTFINTNTTWENVLATTGYAIKMSNFTVSPQYTIDYESRVEKEQTSNEILDTSFGHVEHIPALGFQIGPSLQILAAYSYREDFESVEGDFRRSSVLLSPEADIRFDVGTVWNSSNRVAYRERRNDAFFRDNLGREDVKGIAIRSSNDIRLFQRTIDTGILYDVATESRAILQESYLEVGPEFGQYVWTDLNGDGVQQIDEFFPEQSPNEGTFIRQLLPSDELLPVVSLQARWRLRVDPIHIFPDWRSRGKLVKFMANTVYNSIIDIREQNRTSNIEDIYMLQLGKFRDGPNTLNGRFSWNQELQLFRRLNQIDARLSYDMSDGLARQAAGLEESSTQETEIFTLYRFPRYVILSGAYRQLERRNESDELSSRNYNIRGWEVEPGFRIQISREINTGFTSIYSRKQDSFGLGETELTALKFKHDTVIHPTQKLQISYRIEYRDMQINGVSSSLGTFELTDGAGEGRSWLWNIQMNWLASDWVRATLSYDGRTVISGQNVQTMRLSVSATF